MNPEKISNGAASSPPDYYLLVIGASAGGLSALRALLAQLPADFPAPVLIVQHLAPSSNAAAVAQVIQRDTPLPCQVATHRAHLHPGHVYVAPPDRHLLVRDGYLLVISGPHENRYRPAADALFRSAAVDFGARTVGVVLTGMLFDGTAGLDFVKRCGGTAVVQSPTDAEFPSMPESALDQVDVDYAVPLASMGHLLVELMKRPLPPPVPIPDDLRREAAIAERAIGGTEAVAALGHQVPLTCPDCGGSLWEMEHGEVPRYRCHTGHAFTADWLLEASRTNLEETLWVALRMMEERKNLLVSMATLHNEGMLAQQQAERIAELKQHVNRLREFLLDSGAEANEEVKSEG